MEFGIILGDVPSKSSARSQLRDILRQIEAAQRNGFTYITLGQHFLYGSMRWLQPIPTLARLAPELDMSVRLATTIIVVPLHHPVILAEELATLDIVSEGRLIVGAGLGYRREEYDQLGVPFEERVARFREALPLIVQLWTEPRVTHDGAFWKLVDATPHVRPLQTPHPPLWIGAQTAVGVRRAAQLGQAWTIPPGCSVGQIQEWIALFQSERASRGLPPAERFPLRRELVVAGTRDEALSLFEKRAGHRYLAYAKSGRTWSGTEEELSASFADRVKDHAIVGSLDDCVDQLVNLSSTVPVGPVVFRPQWPGMSSSEVVAYLDELGPGLVSVLRDV